MATRRRPTRSSLASMLTTHEPRPPALGLPMPGAHTWRVWKVMGYLLRHNYHCYLPWWGVTAPVDLVALKTPLILQVRVMVPAHFAEEAPTLHLEGHAVVAIVDETVAQGDQVRWRWSPDLEDWFRAYPSYQP